MQLRGCGTALITPFTSDSAIDTDALRSLIEWQIASGIDFLIPCGTTGEASTLTQPERHRVIECTLQAVAGRVPVFAGCTDNNTAEAVDRVRQLSTLPGLSGILSANPFYNRPGQEGQYQHFRAIANATPLPLLLYNIPSRTGANLEPATVARLAEIPNIIGIKESSGSVMQITEVLASVPPTFTVLAGDDGMALPVIALGGHGVVSVASNAFPRQIAAMAHAALAGDWTRAQALNLRYFRIMQAHFAETSPSPVKAVLHLLGRAEENLRLPMVPVSETLRTRLARLLDDLRQAGESLD